ncbi:MAG: AAA family ATPase [Planctomycetaceae bacterium]|nr:hypothetical protein [Planctomycetaceae bacterium]
MYEAHYQLNGRPFNHSPNTECFFAVDYVRDSLSQLVRIVTRGEGVSLVAGPTGTGKSSVCQLLVEHFQFSHQVVYFQHGVFSSRHSFLESVVLGLGLSNSRNSEAQNRAVIREHLYNLDEHPRSLLLIIDDAHQLSPDVLEECRLLTNLIYSGMARVHLVLAGSLKLEDALAHPTLASLNQRVVHRCYLSSLSAMETRTMLGECLVKAGGEPAELFTRDALRKIYEYTEGVPRIIVQLADRAMLLGMKREQAKLDTFDIELAWADLQQLPEPKTQEELAQSSSPASSSIEFGLLSD